MKNFDPDLFTIFFLLLAHILGILYCSYAVIQHYKIIEKREQYFQEKYKDEEKAYCLARFSYRSMSKIPAKCIKYF